MAVQSSDAGITPPQQQQQPEEFELVSFPRVLVSIEGQPPTFTPLHLLCLTYPIPTPLPPAPTPPPLPPRPPNNGTSTPTNNPFRTAAVPTPPPTAVPLPDKDVLLLLRLGFTDVPLLPTHHITHAPAPANSFTFPDAEPPFTLVFPSPGTDQDAADIETFEVLLRDYGILLAPGAEEESFPDPPEYPVPADHRGHVLLIDQSDGTILGELDEPSLQLCESPELSRAGHEKDPVVITLPSPDPSAPDAAAQPAEVRPAQSSEEFDLILRGANLVSRAITGATSALSQGISYAAQLYVTHVPPDPKGAVALSPEAQARLRAVHQVSGTAVRVTAKTTGVVHRFIDRAIDKAGEAANGLRPPASGGPPSRWGTATSRGGKLLNRVLMSTDLLLTTLESSAQTLVSSTTEGVSRTLEHRYGPEVGDASRVVGDTVRNVGVVYIDARGVGHRALLKRLGVQAVRVTVNGKKVTLAEEQVAATRGELDAAMRSTTSGTALVPGPSVERKPTMTDAVLGAGLSAGVGLLGKVGKGKAQPGAEQADDEDYDYEDDTPPGYYEEKKERPAEKAEEGGG